MREADLGETRNTIPDSLKKNKYEDVPSDYISVYHATRMDNLEKVAKDGIMPYGENVEDLKKDPKKLTRIELRKLTDNIIDKYANEAGYPFTRSGSFYCSPEVGDNWNKADVILEVKLDANKVSVFDSDLVTAVTISWLRTTEGLEWLEKHPDFPPDGDRGEFLEKLEKSDEYRNDFEKYAKEYWQKGIKLNDFAKLSDEEKRKRIKVPEILVPFKMDEKFIRVKE